MRHHVVVALSLLMIAITACRTKSVSQTNGASMDFRAAAYRLVFNEWLTKIAPGLAESKDRGVSIYFCTGDGSAPFPALVDKFRYPQLTVKPCPPSLWGEWDNYIYIKFLNEPPADTLHLSVSMRFLPATFFDEVSGEPKYQLLKPSTAAALITLVHKNNTLELVNWKQLPLM